MRYKIKWSEIVRPYVCSGRKRSQEVGRSAKSLTSGNSHE
jgi:hypothetical protein